MQNKKINVSDSERGKQDCIKGSKVSHNESLAYHIGYGKQYEAEQNATAKSELQLRGLK